MSLHLFWINIHNQLQAMFLLWFQILLPPNVNQQQNKITLWNIDFCHSTINIVSHSKWILTNLFFFLRNSEVASTMASIAARMMNDVKFIRIFAEFMFIEFLVFRLLGFSYSINAWNLAKICIERYSHDLQKRNLSFYRCTKRFFLRQIFKMWWSLSDVCFNDNSRLTRF